MVTHIPPLPPELSSDPRVDDRYLRRIPGDDAGDVLLVGVVHDHPASVYRAAALVDALSPDVVAVELPPLAVPAFTDGGDDDATGGEMRAAIRTADDARVAGIDGPSLAFVREFVRTVRRERPSPSTVRGVLSGVTETFRQALAHRLDAAPGHLAFPGLDLPETPSSGYESTADDDPAVQAADERRHLSRSRSLLEMFEAPPALRLHDLIREATMASRLRSLRREGPVVAVVGFDHLDDVAAALDD